MQLTKRPARSFELTQSWPFSANELVLEGEARLTPSEGKFLDEAAMRTRFAGPSRTTFRATLSKSG